MSERTLLPLYGVALLLLGGCATTEKRLSAKEYYNQANDAFTRENFSAAVDYYHDLLDQYPLNPYAEEAQLKVAYSYYLEKKYVEAVAAFGDFERAYPTSSHLPFVQYYRGMCYLEQMRSIDRDQSVTEKALDFFRTVVDRYPESPFSPLAEEKIRVCRDALAARELYIADFDYKIADNPLATLARLRRILEIYPETDAATTALARLEPLLNEGGKTELAELAAKALAVRRSAKIPPERVASLNPTDLPEPSVDPLLLLVAELKKAENEIRNQVHRTPEIKPVGTEKNASEEEE
ncbi:MAG TPA: outer membrane protein assembly factor BamD [Candidatus Binatia bacterium]|nr:outer membrane protein assembly factor BamD [Candidatus Binatia bacterium]